MTLQVGPKYKTKHRRFAVLRKMIRILQCVTSGDYCVKEIAEITGINANVVGRYLAVLEEEIPEIKVEIKHQRRNDGRPGVSHKKFYRWIP